MHFRQITIIGVGLIGGSFALAARRAAFRGRITGCDRSDVLLRARNLGAIDEGFESAQAAVVGSDLVLLAAPVGANIDLIGQIPLFPRDALVTDVGSTKQAIVARAQAVLGEAASTRFLPGHPLAGKETGGIEHADAELFHGATWLITPVISHRSPVAGEGPAPLFDMEIDSGYSDAQKTFLKLVEQMEAHVVEISPQGHDRLCAWMSHLPQMVATALASVLEEEWGGEDALPFPAGRGLREMTRLADSPYSMWRDIALTNKTNLADALLKLEQRLAHLRESLSTRGLEEQFAQARKFRERMEPSAGNPFNSSRR